MAKKGKIALYRERLDETLASDDLTDENNLKILVKDHILRSSLDNMSTGGCSLAFMLSCYLVVHFVLYLAIFYDTVSSCRLY